MKYRVLYRNVSVYEIFIDADSERDALLKVEGGLCDYGTADFVEDYLDGIESVMEVPA